MIATFITKPNILHVVFSVARDGFKAKVVGYCNAIGNAAEGTYQVPEWAFDGRKVFMIGNANNAQVAPCAQCAAAIKALREPPR